MTGPKINNFFVPNVSKLKGQKTVDLREQLGKNSTQGEFEELLKVQLENKNGLKDVQEIQLSSHAAKRLKERNLEMDANEFFKLKKAIGTLRDKGGHDSLVITDKAAYIVDVDNNKVVTALEKKEMAENVFTKIDSTIFIE
ncbi:MAG: hypothetical protein A2381_09210 [Bdellovibrionales bacterium RIFOXYB1_FULL_37_110]|nr:MAG: hypothetical protein A2417_03595 [Bdellovibrionales bacterium RIFOXYC1_FULL_37_79]OFZ61062.1 MAG: hypothetical protein A2381_09210 [Bdellovibrionales bacterium RIFOXYB1_FULL_37_110]